MMCKLCNEIFTIDEAKEWLKNHLYDEVSKEYILVDYVNSMGMIVIIEDQVAVIDVKFCPECGRKLVE